MKQTVTLTITSLLTILFATFDLADDIVRGFSTGGLSPVEGSAAKRQAFTLAEKSPLTPAFSRHREREKSPSPRPSPVTGRGKRGSG